MDKVLTFFVFLAVGAGFSLLFSYPVELLWNGCVVPLATGIHPVTWLQAWGLTILISMLNRSSSGEKS